MSYPTHSQIGGIGLNQAGFTIIEVLVALALSLVSIFGALGLLNLSYWNQANQKSVLEASAISSKIGEALITNYGVDGSLTPNYRHVRHFSRLGEPTTPAKAVYTAEWQTQLGVPTAGVLEISLMIKWQQAGLERIKHQILHRANPPNVVGYGTAKTNGIPSLFGKDYGGSISSTTTTTTTTSPSTTTTTGSSGSTSTSGGTEVTSPGGSTTTTTTTTTTQTGTSEPTPEVRQW